MIFEIFQLSIAERKLLYHKVLSPISVTYKQFTPKLVTSFFSSLLNAKTQLGSVQYFQMADFTVSISANSQFQVLVFHKSKNLSFGSSLADNLLGYFTKYSNENQDTVLNIYHKDMLTKTLQDIIVSASDINFIQNVILEFNQEIIASRTGILNQKQLDFLKKSDQDFMNLIFSSTQKLMVYKNRGFSLIVHVNKRKTEVGEIEYSLSSYQSIMMTQHTESKKYHWRDVDEVVKGIHKSVAACFQCMEQFQ